MPKYQLTEAQKVKRIEAKERWRKKNPEQSLENQRKYQKTYQAKRSQEQIEKDRESKRRYDEKRAERKRLNKELNKSEILGYPALIKYFEENPAEFITNNTDGNSSDKTLNNIKSETHVEVTTDAPHATSLLASNSDINNNNNNNNNNNHHRI